MTTDDLSQITTNERTEAALNPTRGDVDTGYDPDSDPHAWPSCFRAERDGRQHPPHPGEPCGDDPWDLRWCICGGPLRPDETTPCDRCVGDKHDERRKDWAS